MKSIVALTIGTLVASVLTFVLGILGAEGIVPIEISSAFAVLAAVALSFGFVRTRQASRRAAASVDQNESRFVQITGM